MGNTNRRQLQDNNQRLLNNNNNNNDSILEQNEGHAININQPQVKYTKAYKNPTFLKRNTLKLERDALQQNIFYIQFEYDSLLDFNINVYFNALRIPNSISLTQQHFNPGPNFANNIIQLVSHKGGNVKYSDPLLFINTEFFFQNKVQIEDSFDVVIEMISFSSQSKYESVLSTSFNLMEEVGNANEVNRRISYKIKNIKQEILIEAEKKWLVMNDVFGVPGESASFECEICCTNKRNTIFLPCKHSYTCSNCSHSLRMRNNPCPICRNAITDFLFITQESDNQNVNM